MQGVKIMNKKEIKLVMDVIAIPRSGKAEHVLQNLEAGKVHLTVEEYARLDAAFPAPRKKTYLDIV